MSEGRDSRFSGMVRLQTFSVSALWVDQLLACLWSPDADESRTDNPGKVVTWRRSCAPAAWSPTPQPSQQLSGKLCFQGVQWTRENFENNSRPQWSESCLGSWLLGRDPDAPRGNCTPGSFMDTSRTAYQNVLGSEPRAFEGIHHHGAPIAGCSSWLWSCDSQGSLLAHRPQVRPDVLAARRCSVLTLSKPWGQTFCPLRWFHGWRFSTARDKIRIPFACHFCVSAVFL